LLPLIDLVFGAPKLDPVAVSTSTSTILLQVIVPQKPLKEVSRGQTLLDAAFHSQKIRIPATGKHVFH
jgi:hypothetical protein